MTQSVPWWHPEELRRRRPHLRNRAAILQAMRSFFAAQSFSEVETPALQISPGMEPHLLAFATQLQAPDGDNVPMYLHTSPEFAMKKLLAGGVGPIYQFARTFRNGERSATHHPEFTMLEWYRPAASYTALIDDCQALLAAALAAVPGARRFRWQGLDADPARVEVMTVAAAFHRHAGVDLLGCLHADGSGDRPRLAEAAATIGVRTAAEDTFDDIFFRIFLDRIEPKLGTPHPLVLTDYPLCMAALSRRKAEEPRLAERFELYVCGLELANAFGELTDWREQARRFAEDQAHKRALFGYAYPVDEDFIAALRHGLPDCAGIALGFDRLVMLASGATHIEQVLWAPVAERP